jgi:hypothetical protein
MVEQGWLHEGQAFHVRVGEATVEFAVVKLGSDPEDSQRRRAALVVVEVVADGDAAAVEDRAERLEAVEAAERVVRDRSVAQSYGGVDQVE